MHRVCSRWRVPSCPLRPGHSSRPSGLSAQRLLGLSWLPPACRPRVLGSLSPSDNGQPWEHCAYCHSQPWLRAWKHKMLHPGYQPHGETGRAPAAGRHNNFPHYPPPRSTFGNSHCRRERVAGLQGPWVRGRHTWAAGPRPGLAGPGWLWPGVVAPHQGPGWTSAQARHFRGLPRPHTVISGLEARVLAGLGMTRERRSQRAGASRWPAGARAGQLQSKVAALGPGARGLRPPLPGCGRVGATTGDPRKPGRGRSEAGPPAIGRLGPG